MIVKNDFIGEVSYEENEIIQFQKGILGFESYSKFILVENVDPQFPFSWLQCIEEEHIAFILTSPFLFVSEYDFDIPDDVIKSLNIDAIDDVTILSMVVIPEDPKETTINLKSPIVFNNKTKIAQQVILEDDFDLKHKIFEKEAR